MLWTVATNLPTYLDMIEKIPSIELNEGIPSNIDFDEFLEVSRRIIYDLMTQSEDAKHISDLFAKGSLHRMYIVQNIFHQGKQTTNISLNAQYIALFKSPRDKQ